MRRYAYMTFVFNVDLTYIAIKLLLLPMRASSLCLRAWVQIQCTAELQALVVRKNVFYY
jgi:hypothetical protein